MFVRPLYGGHNGQHLMQESSLENQRLQHKTTAFGRLFLALFKSLGSICIIVPV